MKKMCFVLMAFMAVSANFAVAQCVTLRFTGSMGGAYVPLSYVEVENLSRNWVETVTYPDTVLELTASSSGLSTVGVAEMAVKSFPNPCNGTALVQFEIPESGMATLQLFSLEGRCVTATSLYLEAGCHSFSVSMRSARVNLLTVSTQQGCRTVKIINLSASGNNSIKYRGFAKDVEKMRSSQRFALGDTLSFVGYASRNGLLYESRQIVQPQTASQNITLVFDTTFPGSLNGVFSVSDVSTVCFSKGNLQFRNNGKHRVATGEELQGVWRFATNQWDTICHNNTLVDSVYAGWFDLFGWGTSGYDNKPPYMIGNNGSNFGTATNTDISGTYYDWGLYNAISNGGDRPRMWRTLTYDEWYYLIYTRTNAAQRYGFGRVGNVNGLIILPDTWTLPMGLAFTAGNTGWTNIYNASQWQQMEAAGAVFVPAAGFRNMGTLQVSRAGTDCSLWSSTTGTTRSGAVSITFSGLNINIQNSSSRANGLSVRLVRNVGN